MWEIKRKRNKVDVTSVAHVDTYTHTHAQTDGQTKIYVLMIQLAIPRDRTVLVVTLSWT